MLRTEIYKLYIVVRTDREFSRGKLMVHAGHICSNLHVLWPYNSWYENDQIKIVLQGKDEAHLLEIVQKAKDLLLFPIAIRDAGFYEVEPDTLIMVGILVTDNQARDIGLKKLRLFK